MMDFFPDGDASQEPQVSNPIYKRWILNKVGLCLMTLGRLGEAPPFYERSNAIQLGMQNWSNASITYLNLAELYVTLGALIASADAAREALMLARKAEDRQEECNSLCCQASSDHLLGNLESADAAFAQAEKLEQEIVAQENIGYLSSLRGIQHADHLRRVSQADYARRVTRANLEIRERNRWLNQISWCHRVLGDLDADAGQHDSAREHYDTALKIARSISFRPVLIEALFARGWWAAKYMKDATSAFNDLNEALGYAVEGGYRRYEADIRVALAWANLTPIPSPSPVGTADRGREQARVEAERTLQMSKEMGYSWGKVDAGEVLAALSR
jgi:tetratricopeptide (TPR) repeat protein